MIPQSSMIAKVDGVMNAVSVVGDRVGETMYYGAGAGGDATASAVIADIVDIVRGNHGPMLGYKKGLESGFRLLPREEIVTQYYLRMQVADESGVLAAVTSELQKYEISIESMLQKPTADDTVAKLLFTTHACQESKMQDAIAALAKLTVVKGEIAMMRIEK
jgi:homoserine dehydrogenase